MREEKDFNKWDYANNSLVISHYPQKKHFLEISKINMELKRKLNERFGFSLVDAYFAQHHDYGGILLVNEPKRLELLELIGEIPNPERQDYLGLLHQTDPSPWGCEKRSEINLGQYLAEVFYCRDGGSSFSASFVVIRVPHDEEFYEIEICRDWNDENIINPHAISPERLLKKARPLLQTLVIGKDKHVKFSDN